MFMHIDVNPDPIASGASRAERLHGIRRVLIIVLLLNLAVAFAKLGYGAWTGSIAMRADGVQSFLDGLANVVGLVAVAVAARPPDEEHHFGHERYETLASLLIAGMMSVGVIQILQDAFGQLQGGTPPTVNAGSFGVLFATMLVNLGVSIWERRQGQRYASDLLLADAKHTASDIIVSMGVVFGLLGVRMGWTYADSLVSILITFVIAWAAWTIIRDATKVLTDATDVNPRALMRTILETEGVVSAHKLRARSSGGRLLAQVDIAVDPQMPVIEAHDIASRVERSIMNAVGEESQVVVHIEPAIGRHVRPDLLFGDVQVTRHDDE
jgi:cation diffusion facilitator family transporter